MSVRIETLAELKSIRFDKNETVFCVQNGREYYLELDGGSFTPDDIDFVQAIHGGNARYIAISGSTSGHSSTIASQTDAESGIENTKPMTSLRTKQAVTAYGELSANKGQANGYPSLDSSSRIPLAQLPTSVQTLKGSWNASTNTPTLADGTGTSGDTYRVSVAATRNLGSGNISFGVDDRVVYNGTTWEKWDTNDAVTSVHGRTGDVTAQAGDYAAFYSTKISYAKLSDVKANNTAAGGATTGSFITRTLNTEDTDADNIVSLASNQFTLGAGTYEIRASAPGYRVDRHKAVLYNVTDSVNTIIGTSENCSSADDVQTRSHITGRFTIAGTKVFEIRQRFQTGQGTNGMGLENGFSVSEVYTVVELWKVA